VPAIKVRPLSVPDAQAISRWRYPGRYSTYNVVERYSSEQGVWAVARGSQLVGYCCFGPEARVPGIDEQEGTLDVGYGMHPDLVGQGLGRSFVGAILDFALAEFSPNRFRLLILSWNRRSSQLARALGFEKEGGVHSVAGDFLVMVREAEPGEERGS
jgi:[ribosomal protein S18]-alanine N-acetyltransferase